MGGGHVSTPLDPGPARPASGAIAADDRGVSPVFAYTLTLAVTALLVAGLVAAAGGYVDQQRERTIENQLSVVGHQLSADIAAADRLVRSDDDASVRVGREVPETVVGSTYTVHVRKDAGLSETEYYLELVSTDHDVSVTVAVASMTTVEETSVGGGEVVVEYDGSKLVVTNA